MSHTLIATLGRSPGAVTSLVHELIEKGIDGNTFSVTHLRILSTTDDAVQRSFNAIQDYFTPLLPNLKIYNHPINEPDQKNAGRFYRLVVETIQYAKDEDKQPIIAGIAGGRTSMGALLAIGAQLYDDVIHTCHIWVSDELQREGDIDNLAALKRRNKVAYDNVFNPAVGERQLVKLPNLRLTMVRKVVDETPTLSLETPPDGIDVNTINTVLAMLPGRLTIADAKHFMEIYERINIGQAVSESIDGLKDLFENAGYSVLAENIEFIKYIAGRSVKDSVETWFSNLDAALMATNSPLRQKIDAAKTTTLTRNERIMRRLTEVSTSAAVAQVVFAVIQTAFMLSR